MKHKMKIVENLLYYGCEKHFQCELCGQAYPVHCYTKEQLEEFDCRNDYKIGDKIIYNPVCKCSDNGEPRYIILKGTILSECLNSCKDGTGTPGYYIGIDEVVCDDSGNGYFEYLHKTKKKHFASVEHLKRIKEKKE
ncbi:hypothetical protein IKA92_07420 [bacterium]|nr:hypothetical protein [bacterium]MBR2387106.1 hypothetical protein [bacterium]